MARFYDPVEGTVTYGGVNLADATFTSVRHRIAVVPQEGFLFHGTILDNVRLADDSASEQDVRRALRTIGCEERFDRLPDRLQTEVRERGSRLSAGERQLVSLARAALANPDVLILDEATSSLDPGTESEVERALSALMKGRTVIVIAHRLSTAERADRVGVVDAGGLVELGSHEELLSLGGRYSALYRAWIGQGRSDRLPAVSDLAGQDGSDDSQTMAVSERTAAP
jgi:ATP-binding cassette subfamily B protein